MENGDVPIRPDSASPGGSGGYRADIDGLRALAILPVVGYHAFPEVFVGGFIGVDIFFVISGFLISGIIFRKLEQGSFSSIEFYSRRVRRIFPALILVLAASYVAGWFLLDAEELQQLGKHIAGGAGFVSNFILQGESGYFDVAAEQKILLHLWSLAIEEQFYIVWPLFLGLVWRYHYSFFKITLFVALASFATNIYFLDGNPVAAFYSPLSRFWELMAGCMLAYIALHNAQYLRYGKNLQSITGLILILLSVSIVDDSSSFPGWWTLIPVSGAFLIISAGQTAWINQKILSAKMLVWIGLISYPLYLWHWPLLTFARIVTGETPSAGIRIILLASSFFLAWITFALVEKPLRHSGLSRWLIWVLCLLMVLIGYAGFNAYEREGLEFRHRYDWKSGYRSGMCFIRTDEKNSGPALFSSDCGGTSHPSRKTVLLWGDSHAASLYPGLESKLGNADFNLAQFNSGGCPPVLGFSPGDTQVCPEINRYVYGMAMRIRPDTVILAANWSMYSGRKKTNRLVYDGLEETIHQLRNIPVKNIVLVGQLPVYESKQLKIGKKIFEPNKVDRTLIGLDMGSFDTNHVVKSFAHANGVKFVSPMDLLCSENGCLVSASESELLPLAWDSAHLTGHGSRLLIDLAIRSGQLELPGMNNVRQ